MGNPVEKMLNGRRLVLASGSPRRKELLEMLGLRFEVDAMKDVDEKHYGNVGAMDVAQVLAHRKLNTYFEHRRPSADVVVVAADTVVVADGRVLGKPADEHEAKEMLRMLSGRTHHVITGVAVGTKDHVEIGRQTTEVTFDHLSDDEIDYYIEKYRPMDKAGSYGIQEWIGCVGVSGINGDFYNVMGLPLNLLVRLFAKL
ncbi:MAG: Maf family nucleotide pyrophosphatase [Bacteroides sp.]|nr:Maf family nucleotide pyrophosphatase [Bacteroides sp.]MCM1413995.1 Maf family nucleotide pyrophosphatase [Bacteroides sp.]MCM1472310.1 Maf family nucleotide pyrophosphatase [Bacteroides sp.]